MSIIQKNIEKGLAEITRRENLFISSIGLILPYGLIVMWPASKYLNNVFFLFLILPIIFYLKMFLWLTKTPCPRCGKPVGDFNKVRIRKCTYCSLKIEPPVLFENKITFKKIDYVPGLNKKI
mgnify:CR=1 FL=1|jgi:hypothetical protein